MHEMIPILALGSPSQSGGAGGIVASILPIAAMIAILWFLLIRPQRKDQQRHLEMVKNLKKGDEVVTVGGMFGRIMALDAERVSLKVSDNVKIDVERSKVVRVVTPKIEEVESK